MKAYCKHGKPWHQECWRCDGPMTTPYDWQVSLGVRPGNPRAVASGQSGSTLTVRLHSTDRLPHTENATDNHK